MANIQAPYGFVPVLEAGSAVRTRLYPKASGIIYPGDALKLTSAGAVTVADQGERLVGVAAEYKASADTTCLVYDSLGQIFNAQADGSLTAADVGQNINITPTTGDTAIKRSKHDLDVASIGTEAYKQLKIVGFRVAANNESGNYATMQVMINNSHYANGVSGV